MGGGLSDANDGCEAIAIGASNADWSIVLLVAMEGSSDDDVDWTSSSSTSVDVEYCLWIVVEEEADGRDEAATLVFGIVNDATLAAEISNRRTLAAIIFSWGYRSRRTKRKLRGEGGVWWTRVSVK